MSEEPRSTVNHPPHYNQGRIEVIEAIEDWKLGFNLGNCVKYVARADHKGNRDQDLQKALWYLKREIERLRLKSQSPSQASQPSLASMSEIALSNLPPKAVDAAQVIGIERADGSVFVIKNVRGPIGHHMSYPEWVARYGSDGPDNDLIATLVRDAEHLLNGRVPWRMAPFDLGLERARVDLNIETGEETVLGTIEDKVCHMLNGAPADTFTVDQIEKGTGVERRSLCSCLSRLLRRGVISRPARGVYCSRRHGRVGASRG